MIELVNVHKRYKTRNGTNTVLNNINLVVKKGEKIGVLGRNGAGKSTLIKIISGNESPTSGLVLREMSVSWPLAFSGGFQGSLTGYDNLRFICRIYGRQYDDIKKYVENFTELGKYLNEQIKFYSSGMLARLAFAISMAIEFDCYLIDEVIAVGDSSFHEKCKEELFVKRNDKAYIIVSHLEHIIREHCEKFYVLKSSRLQKFERYCDAVDFYAGR